MTGLRLDKWLWFARAYKTRSLAASFVEGGKVRVNGQVVTKPAYPVRIGDVLDFPNPTEKFPRRVMVLSLSDHRGPACQAQLLYREQDAPPHDPWAD